jgi:glutamate formiminotransferase / formiminotetrahydrofolate cyclodeaminase
MNMAEKKIVECVPNFSEGRDTTIVSAIAQSIINVAGVRLLGVEPDKDYNRSVVTFVGDPEAVIEAAFQATKTAAERIDMRKHTGEHPRIGATDVVPFIPISGVTMTDCIVYAKRYAQRVADELRIPIYLYEAAASSRERKNLSDIRKGEYEGLAAKLKDPKWLPDFGTADFNEKSGATVTGARTFLIAYNVNLKTSNSATAHEIALRIRESGRPKKDDSGNVVKDDKGESIKIPGTLRAVKAMGVLLERFNIAQVSINLTDYEKTPPHIAFEEVKKQAHSLGVDVTGSEIVGLTPRNALLMAGNFYRKQSDPPASEKELIALAIDRLGLNQLDPFVPEKKIIEYQLES